MTNEISDLEDYFVKVGKGEVYQVAIDDVERRLIEKALEIAEGNQLMASKILGLNRNTLHAKIKKLDINADRFRI